MGMGNGEWGVKDGWLGVWRTAGPTVGKKKRKRKEKGATQVRGGRRRLWIVGYATAGPTSRLKHSPPFSL